ncbi:MAG: hypothetical protein ACUVV4_06165 [Candidatus Bathyarchaeia archaeon]
MQNSLNPRYIEALSNKNSRIVAKTLAEAGGIARYSQLERASGIEGNNLIHHLNKLCMNNIIDIPVKGTYVLKFRTPLCYIYDSKGVDYAYLGLLGHRDDRTEPETSVALRLLREDGIEPRFKYVVTSPEALMEWKDIKPPYEWILVYDNEIIDIDNIRRRVEPQLESLLRDYVVILDCTSSTKPATIAFYELAQRYLAPLVYVYEGTKQMKWLISKEDIRKKLGL